MKRVDPQEFLHELLGTGASSKQALVVFELRVFRKCLLHHLDHVSFLDTLRVWLRVDLSDLGDHFFLLFDMSQGENLPKLWNSVQKHSREIKFDSTSVFRSFTEFLHHLMAIYSDITNCVQNFSDHWKYNKVDVILVWMIFEHMHCCHHGPLHWRGEHYFPVNIVDLVLMGFTLHNADRVEFRINQRWILLNCSEFRRILAVSISSYHSSQIEFGKTVSDKDIRGIC